VPATPPLPSVPPTPLVPPLPPLPPVPIVPASAPAAPAVALEPPLPTVASPEPVAMPPEPTAAEPPDPGAEVLPPLAEKAPLSRASGHGVASRRPDPGSVDSQPATQQMRATAHRDLNMDISRVGSRCTIPRACSVQWPVRRGIAHLFGCARAESGTAVVSATTVAVPSLVLLIETLEKPG
jgi:hypothetical protein